MLHFKWLLAALGFAADVITVTSGTAGNAGSTAAELQTYFSLKLLEVAELNMILDQFGEKVPIPSNSSKTIRFNRLEKLPVEASPTQLTEGVQPDAEPITINQFEAVAEQYGRLVRISDLAELTAKHAIVQSTIHKLGLQAAEIYDQLIFNVLDAASNVIRPQDRSADTALLAADQVSYIDLTKLEATLMDNGGRPFSGGEYIFICPPQVFSSLLRDPDFKASNQFQRPDRIWRGEVGMLGGLRMVRSNAPGFAATAQSTSGFSDKVYSSFALAQFAYQISDLQNLRVYAVAPGGHTDALEQSRKLGWKFAFKSIITNQTWIRRVRSSGADSANTA